MLGKRTFRFTLATALVGAVAIVAPITSGAAGDERGVNVSDFQFGDGGPDGNVVTIGTGDMVTWHIIGGEHNIAADDPQFFPESGPLTVGQQYGPITFNITTDMDIPYHCVIHPSMTGIVRIVAPATTTTTATTAPPTTVTTQPTTTTTRPTTSTTAPPTTTTTAGPGPGPTTTTPPTTVAPGTTGPTTATTAGPAPTTTTGKAKDKAGKAPGNTTTTKPRKGNGTGDATGEQPPADPGDQPVVEEGATDVPALESGGEFEAAQVDPAPEAEEAAPPRDREKGRRDRSGMGLLLGTGGVVGLLGLGGLIYKWRTRDSQYWTA